MIKNNFSSFEIIVLFVFAPINVILERNEKRCKETMRCVSDQSILKIYDKMEEAFYVYKDTIEKCYKVRNYSDDNNVLFLQDIDNICI